jgi:predicted DNA-binding protein with PD1-like motif
LKALQHIARQAALKAAVWGCTHSIQSAWVRYIPDASRPEVEPDLRDDLLFLLHPASIAENLREKRKSTSCEMHLN